MPGCDHDLLVRAGQEYRCRQCGGAFRAQLQEQSQAADKARAVRGWGSDAPLRQLPPPEDEDAGRRGD